jgi:hypothetical protein
MKKWFDVVGNDATSLIASSPSATAAATRVRAGHHQPTSAQTASAAVIPTRAGIQSSARIVHCSVRTTRWQSRKTVKARTIAACAERSSSSVRERTRAANIPERCIARTRRRLPITCGTGAPLPRSAP